jgi:hypothetical protein
MNLNILQEGVRILYRLIKPADSRERWLTIASFAYFSTFAVYLLSNYTLDKDVLGMMGYDTPLFLVPSDKTFIFTNIANWKIRHPLFTFLYLPVIILDEILRFMGINITWALFTLCTTGMMSMTGLMIFKVLRYEKLCDGFSLLCLLFYYSFAYVMLLSIQIESFVVTMFFSMLLVSYTLKQKKNIVTDNILFLGMTGTTLTNAVKVLLVQLFQRSGNLCFCIRRFFLSTLLFFFCLLITIPNLVERMIHSRYLKNAFFDDTFQYQGTELNKFSLFTNNFLFEPLLFHQSESVYSNETILLPAYQSWAYYIPVTAVYILAFTTVILNWKNIIVKLFLVFWSIDIFITFIIGYGVEEGQIMCGHWFFFLPLLMGVLLKNIGYMLIRYIIVSILSLITIFFFSYNVTHLF